MFANASTLLAPRIEVLINEQRLPELALASLMAATVTEDVDAPGMFTLEFTAWDLAQARLQWIDDDRFALGNSVDIRMGYGNRLESLIIGEITGLEPEFDLNDGAMLVVRGHDLRHRLLRGHKTRSFVKQKDSQIAQQIASEQNLTCQVEDSGVELEYVLQHNQTDWEFLKSRASRLGYEVAMENKTLHFRSHRQDQAKVLTLTREDDLLYFSPRLSSLNQVKQVEVRGWLPKQKEPATAKVTSGNKGDMGGKTSGAKASQAFGTSSHTVVSHPFSSPAEAQQIAQGQFNQIGIGYITGEGACQGNTLMRAGKVIEIKNVGQKFSGLYYVTAATHTYAHNQGYRTQFTIGRNAT